jgi:hypothetical protein
MSRVRCRRYASVQPGVIRMVPVDTLPIEADRTMTPKDVYVAFEVKP